MAAPDEAPPFESLLEPDPPLLEPEPLLLEPEPPLLEPLLLEPTLPVLLLARPPQPTTASAIKQAN